MHPFRPHIGLHNSLRILSHQSKRLKQSFLAEFARLSTGAWWRILPMAIATLVVLTLLLLGICERLENLVNRHLLLVPPITLSPWLWLEILAMGVGLGCILPRWKTQYQLTVLGLLGLGWGIGSLLLSQQGYAIPVITHVLFFGLNAIAVGVTAIVQVYIALQRSEERYALAARGSNEGLWDWNLQADRLFLSTRWLEMAGYEENELGDSSQVWFDRVHPLDLAPLKLTIDDHLQGHTSCLEHEYRLRHRDGTYRWMLIRGLAVPNQNGKPERIVGSQTDISLRKHTEDELFRSAFFDKLTDLPNRTGFANYLQQAIDRTQKYPMTAFAVLWVDIDCFETINNSLGSAIGDRLLVATAQRLRSFLSPDDVVARMGGDEFGVLLTEAQDDKTAISMAERFQHILALPFNIDGREVFLTVSIGIALSSTRYTEAEHLLRDADTAMHRAKAFGRARYQIFDQSMRTQMVVKLLLENDLRRAISQEAYDRSTELQLFYQPIVHLATGQIVGFEALVRWQHPEHGTLSPQKFIAMAEETGLIVPMSWWVLRSACRQMRKWQRSFPDQPALTMSVNLSSQQFSMPELIESIKQILAETQLDGRNLKLEMTESMVMENAASVISVLHQLRRLGIQLAIDDFGTGYSSLSYLTRFPVNTLKIDRSFVGNIDISSDSLEIVRTIHVLAQNLGMDVTAEGVETSEQATQLLAMNCEYGQGFFFAQPLTADAATNLLIQQQQQPHWSVPRPDVSRPDVSRPDGKVLSAED